MKNLLKIWAASLLAIALMTSACSQGGAVQILENLPPVDREYELQALIHGYYGIGGDIHGVKNPVLTARAGETVRIILVNGETMPHDIALKAHDVRSPQILHRGEKTTLTFAAKQDDTYYCVIPGHVQTGMIGDFKLITD